MLLLFVVHLFVVFNVPPDSIMLIDNEIVMYSTVQVGCIFLTWALAIFFGIAGNKMTGKAYLEQGWVFANPDSESAKIAKMKWGIPA